MEVVDLKLPDTLEEDELLRLPATWEEYMALLDEAPYSIQFLNGEIIMSQATATHEELVSILIWLFKNALIDQPEYRVLGSNVKIVLVEQQSDFNADLSIVRGPFEYGTTPKGRPSKAQIKNPEIVVEVLSKSTRKFDRNDRLSYYKLIPSLRHILLVDQTRSFVSVYTRTEIVDEWLNHDYRTLDSVIRLGTIELAMEAIYRTIKFD